MAILHAQTPSQPSPFPAVPTTKILAIGRITDTMPLHAQAEHFSVAGVQRRKQRGCPVALVEDTLVTNNRTNFAALYTQEELHAGLVIVVPNVSPAQQRALFQAALSHTAGRELLNAALEVDIEGASITCQEYPHPVS